MPKNALKKQKLFLKKNKINEDNFTWIEPSVGSGSFYNNLDVKNKVGIDLDKKIPNVLHMNWYKYKIKNPNSIVIGNPPFGFRGEDALAFINHYSKAKIVAFILPMFFESIGKGSARFRVKNKVLAKSIELKPKSFFTPSGKEPQVYTVFQIWVDKELGIKPQRNINWYEKDKFNFA